MSHPIAVLHCTQTLAVVNESNIIDEEKSELRISVYKETEQIKVEEEEEERTKNEQQPETAID